MQNVLQLPFFFFLLFRVSVFGPTAKNFLCMSYRLLPKTCVTNTGLISLNTLKKVCVILSMRVTYLIASHSQHPKNFEDEKLENKIDGDTEDSTAPGSTDKVIGLIKRKF